MLLLQQMIVLFIYIVIGYTAARKGIIDEDFSKKISWIVVEVANPALTVSAVVNGDGTIKGRDLLLTVLLAVIILCGMVVLSQIIPRLFRIRGEKRKVYTLMTAFNNIGFMGFPVIVAVYGAEALLYASVFSVIFNVIIYTYGIQTIRSDRQGKIEWKQILNIGVFSSVVAIGIYLTEIPTPEFFRATMSGLGNLTGPLSMIVIGISLTSINIKELFTDMQLLSYSFVKLLVIPIAAMLVINRFVDNEMLCGVCMIMLATPAASMTAMLAQQYGSEENGTFGAKGVALTTLLSVITIPIVSAVVF